ncbi:MAG: TIGR04211 family SH3 domain-containing protein [Gammaproteobacteria bacterium]|jgi:SH3 domain protein|nr:TIGR04211 family SH3 domain-containing protein [Gammaproteobacteria bacterium]
MNYRFNLALFLLLVGGVATAETRWVTDEFEVMMRSGKSTKQSIVRQLRSGSMVEVLETDAEAGYSRVQLSSGTEGWVLSRYLTSTPTARLRLPEVEKRLQASETEQAELRAALGELRAEKQDLDRQVAELQAQNSSLQSQLERITELSADTIQVDEQNNQLKLRLAEAQQRVDALQIENGQLAGRANQQWFLIGGGVLTFGLLMGLILPRISWRKKSSWSDF